jgi:hypothetical protein
MTFSLTRQGRVRARQRDAAVDVIEEIMQEAAKAAVVRIVARWPKDSGRSARGFRVRKGKGRVSIVNAVSYSGSVPRVAPLWPRLGPAVFAEEIRTRLHDRGEDVSEALLGELVRGIPTHG